MTKSGTMIATTIPAIAPDERLLCLTTSAPCVVLVVLGKTGGVDVMIGRTDTVDIIIGKTDDCRSGESLE